MDGVGGTVVRLYFHIGKSGPVGRGECALGKTRRACLLVPAVARVHERAMVTEMDISLSAGISENRVIGFVIERAFDGTPWMVNFGALQLQVSPHARYFVKDDAGKWKSIRLEVFVFFPIQWILPPQKYLYTVFFNK